MHLLAWGPGGQGGAGKRALVCKLREPGTQCHTHWHQQLPTSQPCLAPSRAAPHLQLRDRLLQLRLVLLRGGGLAALSRGVCCCQLLLQPCRPLPLRCRLRRSRCSLLTSSSQLGLQPGRPLLLSAQAGCCIGTSLACGSKLDLQPRSALLFGGQLLLCLGAGLLRGINSRLQACRLLRRLGLLPLRRCLQLDGLLPQLLRLGHSLRGLITSGCQLFSARPCLLLCGRLASLAAPPTTAPALCRCKASSDTATRRAGSAVHLPTGCQQAASHGRRNAEHQQRTCAPTGRHLLLQRRHLGLQPLPVALLHVAQQLLRGGGGGGAGEQQASGLAAHTHTQRHCTARCPPCKYY